MTHSEATRQKEIRNKLQRLSVNYDPVQHLKKYTPIEQNVLHYVCEQIGVKVEYTFLPVSIRSVVDVRKIMAKYFRCFYPLKYTGILLAHKPINHSTIIKNGHILDALLKYDDRMLAIWDWISQPHITSLQYRPK